MATKTDGSKIILLKYVGANILLNGPNKAPLTTYKNATNSLAGLIPISFKTNLKTSTSSTSHNT